MWEGAPPLRIKNDLKSPVEDRRAAGGQQVSSPPRAARRSGQQGDKPTSPIRKKFSLLFLMCKSQHTIDVKAQHERCARRKDTKSMKEIHSHLNLQPPHSPIASKGEESLEIEVPLKKGLLALTLKLWCSSGMEMQASTASDLTLVAWPVHPPLTLLHLTPLL
jgi:hypothetical protein